MSSFRPSMTRGRVPGSTLSGDTGLFLGDEVSQITRTMIETAYPGVGKIVLDRLEERKTTSISKWPVKTGNSRDSIALETRILPDLLTVSLVVRAWYAHYIRSSGFVEGPAANLILNHARRIEDELIRKIASMLEKL